MTETTRLRSLIEREFQRQARIEPPISPLKRFKAVRLNLSKFDRAWDRKRGSAARLMAIVLRDDDAALEQRVCAEASATKTYVAARAWLKREADYLRRTAKMHETAASRLAIALARCSSSPQQAA